MRAVEGLQPLHQSPWFMILSQPAVEALRMRDVHADQVQPGHCRCPTLPCVEAEVLATPDGHLRNSWC
jgi:hypothetical protein